MIPSPRQLNTILYQTVFLITSFWRGKTEIPKRSNINFPLWFLCLAGDTKTCAGTSRWVGEHEYGWGRRSATAGQPNKRLRSTGCGPALPYLVGLKIIPAPQKLPAEWRRPRNEQRITMQFKTCSCRGVASRVPHSKGGRVSVLGRAHPSVAPLSGPEETRGTFSLYQSLQADFYVFHPSKCEATY